MTQEAFNFGDTIAAVHHDSQSVLRGAVMQYKDGTNQFVDIGGVYKGLATLAAEGWEITLVKRAPLPLLTACDYYFDRNGELWYVTPFGKLEFADFSEDQGNRERITKDVQFHRDYGPFVSRTELLKNRTRVSA